MGNPVGGKNLLLSGTPIFFETEKSRADLEKQLLSGKLMIRELSVEGRLQDARTIRFYLKNQLRRNISGTLELTVPLKGSRPKHFSVPFAELRPGIIETVVLRLDNDIAPTSPPIEGIAKTATSSGKFSVPVELIVCPYIAERPKIDGDISEWMKHPALTLETIDFLSPPDAVSHGMWTGNADLSIKAWLGWDSEYFYFAARVSDDIHVRKEGNVFAGDCLQIAFDTRNDALARGYGRDDFEFGFALGKENKPLYSRTWPLPPAVPETILFSARRGNGVTDYEIAIPFKLLKPLGPVEGKVFGFNFVALDADLSASTDYWMGYTYGICGGKNPSVFRKFILGR
ncbi:MAG: hypothetical protein BWY31_01797 [Lentisphaerae bacterium ADurb.Bin242]|nr:MAG: hypothetical protein BWY31_01797 [Lentisphaerae bacterium ADurb.Bin242]